MDDWVLDSLVGFLKSPTWSLAVSGFTDKNCAVFDPGEENKFSYTDIHREYQKLVEGLLEKFTAELGISGDQFTHACSLLHTSKAGQENEDLFEQVLAADDFLKFKDNMVRRNIDLELQALTLLQKQMGHSPNVYDKGSVSRDTGVIGNSRKRLEEEEERLLEEVVKQSEAQYQLERLLDDEELQRLVEQAKRESLELYQKQQEKKQLVMEDHESVGVEGEKGDMGGFRREGGEHKSRLNQAEDANSQAERRERNEVNTLRTPLATTLDGNKVAQNPDRERKKIPAEPPAPPSDTLPPLPAVDKTHKSTPNKTVVTGEVGKKEEEQGGTGNRDEDAMTKWLEVAKAGLSTDSTGSAHSPSVSQHMAGPTPEQLKARELYLKQQRYHLVEAKRKQRATTRQSSSVGGARGRHDRREVSSERESGSTGVSGGGRRGRDTGILSSAIAGNLKKV